MYGPTAGCGTYEPFSEALSRASSRWRLGGRHVTTAAPAAGIGTVPLICAVEKAWR